MSLDEQPSSTSINRTRKVEGKRIHIWDCKSPAIVDAGKFSEVSDFSWHLDAEGYPTTNGKTADGSCISIRLSNLVFGRNHDASKGIIFLNGDRLDCRMANLAIVPKSVVGSTSRLSKANTSGYKGVSWSKAVKKWVAMVWVDGRKITLGAFEDKVEAAKAYDAAAQKHYGEFSMTNKRMGLY